MALLRIWRTEVDVERREEYERFAVERSLPMFRVQDGFLGVIFARDGAHCLVATIWRDGAAVARLGRSSSYAATVSAIGDAGFLVGEASVEVFEIHDAYLSEAVDASDRAAHEALLPDAAQQAGVELSAGDQAEPTLR